MGCLQGKLKKAESQPKTMSQDESRTRGKLEVLKTRSGKRDLIEPREFLEGSANYREDFLTHHLKYELTLTKLTSMKRIQKRQIVEHLYLQSLWGNIGGNAVLQVNCQSLQESMLSAWIQRTFMDIWEHAHHNLFTEHEDVKLVRRKVAEQFMFELFEIKEFVDSGMATINFLL
jgi:hypothetical protein